MTQGLIDLGLGTPRELGRRHGDATATAVRELFEVRLALCRVRMNASDAAIQRLAESHLPALGAFDMPLAQELAGLSESTGLAPWQLVVLNHYTDFRDIRAPATDEGCSVVYLPHEAGPLVAQTWDMHGTAEPYVRLVRGQATGEASFAVFTLTGCLGMAGMNSHGVAIAINNLTPDDARVGVLWPALVRRMLREPTAMKAVGILRTARLGSGHNYLVADPKRVFNVETTATRLAITHTDPSRGTFHTNHYLDAGLRSHEQPALPSSTTRDRFDRLTRGLATPPTSAAALWALLGSHDGHPRSICAHLQGDDPAASKTCGGVLMDPTRRELRWHRGCLHGVPLPHAVVV